MTVYLIPEAGGDAGLGAKSIADKMGLSTVMVDSNPAFSDIEVPGGSRIEPCIERFARSIDGKVVVLPTCEATTPAYALLEKKMVVSGWFSEKAYEVSRDKTLLSRYAWALSLSKSQTGPLFRKPRCGSGARGCVRVTGRADVFPEPSAYFDVLREPYCVVDVVGEQAWSRRVLRQKGGADIDMVFESNPELEEIALTVANDLGAYVMNVQFMFDDNGRPQVIDLAPRFSGASARLMLAGVNPLAALLHGDKQVLNPCRVTIDPQWSVVGLT